VSGAIRRNKPAAEACSERTMLRMTPRHRERLDELAAKAGLSASAWMRRAIDRAWGESESER
jgi:predicted DNA-binding protein